jgi:hypothetical protein
MRVAAAAGSRSRIASAMARSSLTDGEPPLAARARGSGGSL